MTQPRRQTFEEPTQEAVDQLEWQHEMHTSMFPESDEKAPPLSLFSGRPGQGSERSVGTIRR